MFRMFKMVIVGVGCAMFAFILRSAFEDRRSESVDDMLQRMRSLGF